MKLLLALLICSCCVGDELKLTLAAGDIVKERLMAGLVPKAMRESTIRELFVKAGCAPEDQPIDRHASNVICRLPGESDSVITVGAHSDFVADGAGIVDDWSGVALLPSLYESLKQQPRRHTFVFVAFAREEAGLIGSTKYVKALSVEEKQKSVAFVNLECLGLSPPKVWTHRANPALLNHLIKIAKATNIQLEGESIDQVGDDDSHPFMSEKIPVITIHSVTQETFGILHSSRDNVKAINFGEYYNAYRLAAFYLALLDLKL